MRSFSVMAETNVVGLSARNMRWAVCTVRRTSPASRACLQSPILCEEITPEPIKEGHTFRIAARIEKEVNGEVKTHRLIRADTLESHGAAVEASVGKAKLLIDQLGDRLFD